RPCPDGVFSWLPGDEVAPGLDGTGLDGVSRPDGVAASLLGEASGPATGEGDPPSPGTSTATPTITATVTAAAAKVTGSHLRLGTACCVRARIWSRPRRGCTSDVASCSSRRSWSLGLVIVPPAPSIPAASVGAGCRG